MTKDHAVEIIGKVQADLSVRVLVSTDFGTNIGKLYHDLRKKKTRKQESKSDEGEYQKKERGKM